MTNVLWQSIKLKINFSEHMSKSNILQFIHSFIHWYSALEAGLAGTRAQSCDRYGSGTLHPGQFLGGSLPLLSPIIQYYIKNLMTLQYYITKSHMTLQYYITKSHMTLQYYITKSHTTLQYNKIPCDKTILCNKIPYDTTTLYNNAILYYNII